MSHISLPVRIDDPETSVEAARKAALGASRVRPVVLRLITEKGPLTHDRLIGEYQRLLITEPNTPRASESGIRTRLRELVRSGFVTQHTDNSVSSFGNSAKQWVAVTDDVVDEEEAAFLLYQEEADAVDALAGSSV